MRRRLRTLKIRASQFLPLDRIQAIDDTAKRLRLRRYQVRPEKCFDPGSHCKPARSLVLLLVVASLCFLPPQAGAQEFRLGILQSWPGNTRLGSPTGVVVAAGIRPFKRVGIRLAYERGEDRFRTFGSTCVGLIPPEQVPECAPESRREVANLQAISLSAPVAILLQERLEVAMVPTFRSSWFKSERTGVVSDRELNADESMWGFGIGGEVLFQPFSAVPARVFLGAHAGFLGQTEYESIADGYSPFDEGFSLTQVELGIAYRVGR